MAEYNDNQQLDWDSEIEDDGKQFVIVPPGTYNFTVTNFERSHYEGSDKVPPCNMAVITGALDGYDGNATFTERLYMLKQYEWKLSSFFRCIGQKQQGERIKMDWKAVPGARGKVKISTRKHQGKEYNQVESFLNYDDTVGFAPVSDADSPW